MGRKSTTITLSNEDREYLELQTRARTIQAQTVNRARILLLKADGARIDDIADKVGMNRKSVMLCIRKYQDGGIDNALFDAPGRGRNAEITDDEKAWIINIACQKPIDLGYAAETWTRALLTKHINKVAEAAGHTRLSTISQSKVRTILEEADIKPNKIKYYCENRDPDFDQKMHNVLLVYKQLSLQFDENGQLLPFGSEEPAVHVLSYDEKPGIQAIATTSEDLMPDEKHPTISRDYEYKRLGTVSLLAGIDLQTGEAIPLISETHNSKDYIEFLKILDKKYPKGDKIGQGVDLDAKVHLHLGSPLLGPGDLAVKGVKQAAEQQEEAAVIRMPAAGQRHNDPRHGGQEREIGQDDGIVIEAYHLWIPLSNKCAGAE